MKTKNLAFSSMIICIIFVFLIGCSARDSSFSLSETAPSLNEKNVGKIPKGCDLVDVTSDMQWLFIRCIEKTANGETSKQYIGTGKENTWEKIYPAKDDRASAFYGHFSPDNKWLLVVTSFNQPDAKIWIYPVGLWKEPKILLQAKTRIARALWSPNSEQLLVEWVQPGTVVSTLTLDGKEIPILNSADMDPDPLTSAALYWTSKDGLIVYTMIDKNYPGRLGTLDTNTLEKKSLDPQIIDVLWSADGKRTLWNTKDGKLMLDGSKELPVSTNANTIGASCFWSPDGKIIIVGAFDGIYQVDISDMSNIMVKKLVDKGQPIKWFIDGKSIIVVRNDYQQNDQNNQYIESIEITK